MKPTVLFIMGIRDDRSVKMLSIEKDTVKFITGGSSNVFGFIENDRFDKVLLTLDSKNNSEIRTKGFNVIFNQISDFDTHKITLNKVSELLKQMDGNITCINRPEDICLTTRDEISERLQCIDGLCVPRTIRIAPTSPDLISDEINNHQLSFPLLLRESGKHGGQRTRLLNSHDEIKQLYAFALDGRDYYLTEFHDFGERDSNDNTIYKKYRLVIIDGKPYMRHLIISDEWMIHSSSRRFMEQQIELAEEESQRLVDFHDVLVPLIQPAIKAIHERIKLDYFGIDCRINSEGEILVFEINANMNILINHAAIPNKWQEPIELIKQAVIDMVMNRAAAS